MDECCYRMGYHVPCTWHGIQTMDGAPIRVIATTSHCHYMTKDVESNIEQKLYTKTKLKLYLLFYVKIDFIFVQFIEKEAILRIFCFYCSI